MTEPVISCPHCHTDILLTESLAAPLVMATKQEYEHKTSEFMKKISEREQVLRSRENELQQTKQNIAKEIEEKVACSLENEKAKLIEEARLKLQKQNADELNRRASEIKELENLLKTNNEKLQEAQQSQAEFLKKQRELEDQKRELELTVEKRVQQNVQAIHEKARKEIEDNFQLKFSEKEQQIASMQRKIEELKQKAEQGSQQLQGEVQELLLEQALQSQFYMDQIAPVPKGEFGGDVLQHVLNPHGVDCGLMIWEAKRTKHWNNEWLMKLKDDQRAAKADIAIIISHALPQNVETFECIEGVWVIHPKVILPVATLLRESLIQIHFARQSAKGQETKAGMIYDYLTGTRFRQRVEAIVEAFISMQEDLNKEKKVITKQWAKREEQINRVMQSTIGMYGDLQGIVGQSLQEIEGLELDSLLLE
ncbi:Uncharacterized conserved protein [Commensalibacter communis]|uniref:Contains DUF2130 domain n=1 Tax=Commensalibacter communis TaxID=2972786 RepID=A0A9W4X9K6_9PROT|nr:DUF2130 domain-containing protein [Commensalibacter communis]CAI3939487.1 Uncharacterized conserved protein [Commensalibacter communis]CAI3940863.1 Uncharacterized conserved protein [Commensalibacter communis]CAI3944022.1 Uncharacterized conserved protein [Commensalibacter communis]CAI3945775.1 Uncharacterized conserved protein [Commensalibacter communis]